jgi:hypothetical protein
MSTSTTSPNGAIFAVCSPSPVISDEAADSYTSGVTTFFSVSTETVDEVPVSLQPENTKDNASTNAAYSLYFIISPSVYYYKSNKPILLCGLFYHKVATKTIINTPKKNAFSRVLFYKFKNLGANDSY